MRLQVLLLGGVPTYMAPSSSTLLYAVTPVRPLDPTSLSCPYICCILSGDGDCQLTLRKGLSSLPSLTHTSLVSVSLLKDSLRGHCHPQHALTVKEVLIVLLGLLGSWAPERGRIFPEIRIGEASPRLTK